MYYLIQKEKLYILFVCLKYICMNIYVCISILGPDSVVKLLILSIGSADMKYPEKNCGK